MKKLTPKVVIPPLFKKEDSFARREEGVEMVNFNSLFSSDDQDAKRMLKRQIKRKLCNAV
jgi:hypothetical protein